MALFTDGPPAAIESLREYESSILDVASSEKIDLTVKLAVAQRELALELEQLLEGRHPLGHLVVTEPLATWHTFHTLVLTFRDAYHSQLNDRYLAKWKEYERRADWAREALRQLGIGITLGPIARARAPEVWSEPEPAAAAATYCVRVAWAGAGGEEGSPSEMAVLSAEAGNTLAARAADAPAGVLGWNLYAGYAATDLRLQNEAPLAPGAIWRAPAAGLRAGGAPGNGQAPQTLVRPLRLRRG